MSKNKIGKRFTGKTAGKRIRRKGKGLTRKQRHNKRGTHQNKYIKEE